MSRTTTATALVLGLLSLSVAVTNTVLAQSDDDEPAPIENTVTMELIDQSFDLAPNGNIELTYRLSGDLEAVAELTPPTTAPPTTVPPTTVPPTTIPPTTAPFPGAPAPPPIVTAPPTTVAPTTTLPPPDPIVARVVNYPPLESASDLAGLLGPAPSPARFTDPIDGVDLPDVRSTITVADDGTAEITLTVPTDGDPSEAERLQFDDTGIYPIVVQLRINDFVIASHATVVEFRTTSATAPPTIALSLLASVPNPGPTASEDALADSVAEFEELVAATAEIDATYTLDIPPPVATAAALGDDALRSLSTDELLASPATPFDVSSATSAGRIDAFVKELLAGEDELRTALPGIPIRREVWLTTTPLSGEAAAQLRDLGVRYLAMPAAVYESSVADSPSDPLPTRDRFVELDLPNGGTMPLLLIDDELGEEFTETATDVTLANQSTTEWAIETIASLRLEQREAPFSERGDARSHLLATPDLAAPDPRLLSELERLAATTQAIRFVPASLLESVTSAQDQPAESSLPNTAGPSLTARLGSIATVEASLADAASMLPEGDERPADWARQLDSLISTAYSDDEANEVLDDLQEEADTIRGGVIPPEPFTFTLTGPSTIDVRIGNQLDEPIVVLLRLSSSRLTFPDGDALVTLAPNEVTVQTVAVEPRSNGTSPVTVEILTPLESPLVEPVTLTSRVTTLTGLGQVLTGALVLILATWWISHWRTKRRESTNEPVDDAGAPAAE